MHDVINYTRQLYLIDYAQYVCSKQYNIIICYSLYCLSSAYCSTHMEGLCLQCYNYSRTTYSDIYRRMLTGLLQSQRIPVIQVYNCNMRVLGNVFMLKIKYMQNYNTTNRRSVIFVVFATNLKGSDHYKISSMKKVNYRHVVSLLIAVII